MKVLFSNPNYTEQQPDSTPKKDALRNCSIIWFPNKGHAELEVDNILYSILCGNAGSSFGARDEKKKPHTFTVGAERADSGIGTAFYRVVLGLNEEEYVEIKQLLEAKKVPINTCSGSIANLLNRTTKIALPTIQSLSPSGLFSHFWKTKEESLSRVQKIEYYGDKEKTISEEIASSHAQEFACSLTTTCLATMAVKISLTCLTSLSRESIATTAIVLGILFARSRLTSTVTE